MGAILPFAFMERASDGTVHAVEPQPMAADKLFMKPKEFALHVGVSYNKVLDWIAAEMPVLPEGKSPYIIVVPAAVEWLRKRYGF